jgi:lycopene cyclase domain-containing protein
VVTYYRILLKIRTVATVPHSDEATAAVRRGQKPTRGPRQSSEHSRVDHETAAISTGVTMLSISYLSFHLLFVVPPIVLLGTLAVVRGRTWWGRRPLGGLAIIIALAVGYTTPWDNLLIAEGVWWYGEGVTAAHIWEAPVGEYLFFVLQPVLTALWLFQIPEIHDRSLSTPARTRLAGVAAGLVVSVAGFALLGATSTFYLGALLLWAGPVLAIQWGFGWPYLWGLRRTVALAVLVPTLYLCAIDVVALDLGIWVISKEHTVGLALLGLPVEEALFFLLTNLFTVQGIVLYMWLRDRVDVATVERWTAAIESRRPDLR